MDGFLLIDKPKGLTSHDVVDEIRRRFRLRKVGHLGTLDPLATGLLPLAIGEATKLVSYFLKKDKEYEGKFILGITTDTYDIEGKVVERRENFKVSSEDLEKVRKKFLGEREQIPPMYSALKRRGKRLYELAREGKTIHRPPRKITIYSFQIYHFSPPQVEFRIHCSAGTYIRSIVYDIGKILGCGATLQELRRIRCGDFHLKDAYPLERILSQNQLSSYLLPVEEYLSEFPEVKVDKDFLRYIVHGTPVYKNKVKSYPSHLKKGDMVRIMDSQGKLLCLAESRINGEDFPRLSDNNIVFQPRRIFHFS